LPFVIADDNSRDQMTEGLLVTTGATVLRRAPSAEPLHVRMTANWLASFRTVLDRYPDTPGVIHADDDIALAPGALEAILAAHAAATADGWPVGLTSGMQVPPEHVSRRTPDYCLSFHAAHPLIYYPRAVLVDIVGQEPTWRDDPAWRLGIDYYAVATYLPATGRTCATTPTAVAYHCGRNSGVHCRGQDVNYPPLAIPFDGVFVQ
jgi:hypothetical protein